MFYVASNSGSGYTSKLFDRNLGHFDSFILDGSYIFAGQVRKIIIIKHVCSACLSSCIATHFFFRRFCVMQPKILSANFLVDLGAALKIIQNSIHKPLISYSCVAIYEKYNVTLNITN